MTGAEEGLRRLDRELKAARRFGARATREMHGAMAADLKKARKRVRVAEQKAADAQAQARRATRRARKAELKLATIKDSSTWKAGRAVVAVPARLKRWRSP